MSDADALQQIVDLYYEYYNDSLSVRDVMVEIQGILVEAGYNPRPKSAPDSGGWPLEAGSTFPTKGE